MRRFILLIFSMICFLSNLSSFNHDNEAKKLPKNAFSFNLFAPLNYYSEFIYERKVDSLKLVSVNLGLIGLGNMPYDGSWDDSYLYKANGAFLKLGFKKVFSNSSNAFKGFYYNPEIGFSMFNEIRTWNTNLYTSNVQKVKYENNIMVLSVLFKLGYQLNIKNKILVDLYGGIGVCADNREPKTNLTFNYSSKENNFIARRYAETNRFATQLGLKIGYLF